MAGCVANFERGRREPYRPGNEVLTLVPLVKRQLPTGFLRLLLCFPIWLYRAHLSWLLGSRILLLTHRGRRSGLLRQTVVEVIQHDAATGTYFIASGWGEKSNWLRNLQKTPEVTVQVSRQAFAATAGRLSHGAAQHALFTYAQHHPAAFRMLARVLTGRRVQGSEEDCRTLAQSIPVVALRPRHGMMHRWPILSGAG